MEECGDWYRGTCPRRPRTVGLFPKSYIHIKDLSKTDPVVAECTQVLREWSEIWKQLFVVSHLMDKLKFKLIMALLVALQKRENYKFISLRKVMLSLLEIRRELLGATLTQDQTLELQMTVISKIDWGNR